MKEQFSNRVQLYLSVFALAISMNTLTVFSQAPELMSYQAVIRTPSNALVVNQSVGMRMSILQGSSTGTAVYVETHVATTNANGLVSVQIGGGTAVTGVFANINWGSGPFFIKSETDPSGGTNYTILATSQLISVPYALHAKNGLPSGGTSGQIITMCDGAPTWTTNGDCYPYPSGTVHCNPTSPTLVVPVLNPTTGKIWMDRNLGASQVATSTNDILSFGDLYQWGRFSDGHQCRNSLTTTVISTSSSPNHQQFIINGSGPGNWMTTEINGLWTLSSANNPCPLSFRLPTNIELSEERSSWTNTNNTGAFGSPLKLPGAGSRSFINGGITNSPGQGFYWSGTASLVNSMRLMFNTSLSTMDQSARGYGMSVRCIKN